jgi:hypothetical protein
MSAFGGKADKYERCGISPLDVGTVTDQVAPPWRPPLYFDLARINLDSTTPAMMAPAITRIVVRSMFIDYPFYPWTKCIYTRPMGSQVAEGLE